VRSQWRRQREKEGDLRTQTAAEQAVTSPREVSGSRGRANTCGRPDLTPLLLFLLPQRASLLLPEKLGNCQYANPRPARASTSNPVVSSSPTTCGTTSVALTRIQYSRSASRPAARTERAERQYSSNFGGA